MRKKLKTYLDKLKENKQNEKEMWKNIDTDINKHLASRRFLGRGP